jgi:hypothetical protein
MAWHDWLRKNPKCAMAWADEANTSSDGLQWVGESRVGVD